MYDYPFIINRKLLHFLIIALILYLSSVACNPQKQVNKGVFLGDVILGNKVEVIIERNQQLNQETTRFLETIHNSQLDQDQRTISIGEDLVNRIEAIADSIKVYQSAVNNSRIKESVKLELQSKLQRESSKVSARKADVERRLALLKRLNPSDDQTKVTAIHIVDIYNRGLNTEIEILIALSRAINNARAIITLSGKITPYTQEFKISNGSLNIHHKITVPEIPAGEYLITVELLGRKFEKSFLFE